MANGTSVRAGPQRLAEAEAAFSRGDYFEARLGAEEAASLAGAADEPPAEPTLLDGIIGVVDALHGLKFYVLALALVIVGARTAAVYLLPERTVMGGRPGA